MTKKGREKSIHVKWKSKKKNPKSFLTSQNRVAAPDSPTSIAAMMEGEER